MRLRPGTAAANPNRPDCAPSTRRPVHRAAPSLCVRHYDCGVVVAPDEPDLNVGGVVGAAAQVPGVTKPVRRFPHRDAFPSCSVPSRSRSKTRPPRCPSKTTAAGSPLTVWSAGHHVPRTSVDSRNAVLGRQATTKSKRSAEVTDGPSSCRPGAGNGRLPHPTGQPGTPVRPPPLHP